MARQPRWAGERGAAAVEFALVLPLLVALVFGIVEFGRAFQVQATLAQAAREGARVMAVQNNATAARAAVQATTTSLSDPLSTSQIVITPMSCTSVAGNVTVTLQYRQVFMTGWFGAGVDLTGRGVMRCNG